MKKSILIYIICVASMLAGCRTIKEAHTEMSRDTLIVKTYEYVLDSVYIDRYHNVYVKGDTVFKTDSIINNVWKIVSNTDTIYKSKTDTVYDTTETIVSQRSDYDKAMSIGFWSLLAIMIIYIVVRILIRVYLRR